MIGPSMIFDVATSAISRISSRSTRSRAHWSPPSAATERLKPSESCIRACPPRDRRTTDALNTSATPQEDAVLGV